MNQFCEMKGILRQFSIARTPQQNGVAERRNMTLIEAARTMLADSKLPTTFWAEAVNTACYADEGFFVGYSLNSKAFRVFNSRTRIVEENLHIRFSESTPNAVGSGPDWLFDIDALTRTMNYEPIVAGTQSNGFACTKVSDNAGQARKETEPVKDYTLLPLWTTDPPFSQKSKSSHDDGSKPSSDDGKKIVSAYLISRDDKDDGAEADMNNLGTTIQVSPNLTTRINKDHPLDQVIRDLQLATQTRRMSKSLEEHRRTQKVDLSNGKWAIGTKWVFRNKKDERGIVIRNKARLVAHGYTHEEGINYDEVFAPIARIEAIRLFLAYASFKDFVVYQMDVKSAFLYRKIEEEVYAPRAWYETLSTYLLDNGFQIGKIDKTLFIKRHKCDIFLVQVYEDDIIFSLTNKKLCIAFKKLMHEKFQMSSMGELTFFLGLQVQQKKDDIFISQDKYVDEILKKFRFTEVKTASTPIETQNPLLKDENGEEVDVYMYRSMIGSLMYLTSLRPDIMFIVYACSRYQVNLKVSHLYVVKRIFRYLKGQPKLGLWYPKDSPFDLVAYTDSDYAGASLDRKSTTGGCQFLGCRLISWISKEKCLIDDGKVVWNEIGVNAETHNMVAFLSKSTEREGFEQIATVKVKTVNRKQQLHALVDGKKVIITESIVRRDIQLEDVEGVDCLPSATIFEQLALTGSKTTAWNEFSSTMASAIIYLATNQKFDFSKYIFESMVRNLENVSADEAVYKKLDDSLVRAATTASSLEAEQDSGNINKTRSKATLNEPSSTGTSSGSGPRCQETIGDIIAQTRFENVSKLSNDPLLARVKKLERSKRSRTHRLKRLYKVGLSKRVKSSDEEGLGEEDASKQGRIPDIDVDAGISLVSTHFNADTDMFGVHDLVGDEVVVESEVAAKDVNLNVDEVTLAQALAALKSIKPKAKVIVFREPGEPTTSTTHTTTIHVPKQSHDKDKGIMVEELMMPKKKKIKSVLM
ncbi:putative ribonuclease H-like domain-containing protein [Tanacetum coccineum]